MISAAEETFLQNGKQAKWNRFARITDDEKSCDNKKAKLTVRPYDNKISLIIGLDFCQRQQTNRTHEQRHLT